MDERQLASITRKVRSLMALAESNPNEAEAASAAAKAQELLIAYNLKLSDSAEDTSRGSHKFKGGLYKWQRGLWESIASLHFCMYWSEKGTAKGATFQHKMLGRDVNVVSAKVLAEYLEGAINRLAKDRYPNGPREFFSRDAIAYREGIATRLVNRLNDKRWAARVEAQRQKEAEEERRRASGSTENALVLTLGDLEERERYANHDALNGLPEGTSLARHKQWLADWKRQQAAMKAADEALKIENPGEWQRQQDEAQARADKWRAEDEKRSKRSRAKPKEWKPRADSFYDGYTDGGEISLDEQIEQKRNGGLLC